jgi:hypothetical protein
LTEARTDLSRRGFDARGRGLIFLSVTAILPAEKELLVLSPLKGIDSASAVAAPRPGGMRPRPCRTATARPADVPDRSRRPPVPGPSRQPVHGGRHGRPRRGGASGRRWGGQRWGERVGPTDRGGGEVPSIEGIEKGF